VPGRGGGAPAAAHGDCQSRRDPLDVEHGGDGDDALGRIAVNGKRAPAEGSASIRSKFPRYETAAWRSLLRGNVAVRSNSSSAFAEMPNAARRFGVQATYKLNRLSDFRLSGRAQIAEASAAPAKTTSTSFADPAVTFARTLTAIAIVVLTNDLGGPPVSCHLMDIISCQFSVRYMVPTWRAARPEEAYCHLKLSLLS
jgi:hypothetical protein